MNDLQSSTRRRLLAAIGGGVALGTLPWAPLQAAGMQPVELPDRVDLGVAFGGLGPALLASGAIDAERFATTYRDAGQPLDDQQLLLLHEGSTANVIFDRDNAYFLLNFFWAVGLTNASPILTTGPMMQGGLAQVGRFASTGGWTLGKRPAITLYSSTPLIELTPAQQERVWQASAGVYRPCCGNPVSFPDCNHGMAMLGLLQLLAAAERSTAQLFAAAKAANRFWYPAQTAKLAVYLQAREAVSYAQADGRRLMGRELFSSDGFQRVSAWLAKRRLDTPGGGTQGCSV